MLKKNVSKSELLIYISVLYDQLTMYNILDKVNYSTRLYFLIDDLLFFAFSFELISIDEWQELHSLYLA